MNRPNEKTVQSEVSFSTVKNSRRNFIKLCGAAGVGGVSGLLLNQETVASDSLDLIKSKASEGMFDELFWSFVRSQFALQPGVTYMNTGTEGVMPRYVTSRLGNYFKEFAKNPWDAYDECPSSTKHVTPAAEFVRCRPGRNCYN